MKQFEGVCQRNFSNKHLCYKCPWTLSLANWASPIQNQLSIQVRVRHRFVLQKYWISIFKAVPLNVTFSLKLLRYVHSDYGAIFQYAKGCLHRCHFASFFMTECAKKRRKYSQSTETMVPENIILIKKYVEHIITNLFALYTN